MCVTGCLLRGVLVLLLMLADTCARRGCNYKEILDSYRAVIFVRLHNLNLTDSLNSSKNRDPCPSGKARRILASIYALTQQLRCQSGGGAHTSDAEKPVESMEQLIVRNCRPADLGRRVSCSSVKKIRGKKRKRKRIIRVLGALITCWQKLQSVFARSK